MRGCAVRFVSLSLFVMLGWAHASAPSPCSADKAPVPDAAALAAKLEKLKSDVYPTEYGDLDTPEKRQLLARRMLAATGSIASASVDRYALLDQACALSISASDLATAFSAIDQVDRWFAIDVRERKVAALLAIASDPPPSISPQIAAAALSLCLDSIHVGDAPTASRLLELTEEHAHVTEDGAMIPEPREARAALADYRRVEPAMERLRADPENPEANLAAGSYYCFVLGDFERGAACLSRSSDEALRALALAELVPPSTGAQQSELGGGWRAYAETQEGAVRQGALRRAKHWYDEARLLIRPGDLDRIALDNRIREVDELMAQAAADAAADAAAEAAVEPPAAPAPANDADEHAALVRALKAQDDAEAAARAALEAWLPEERARLVKALPKSRRPSKASSARSAAARTYGKDAIAIVRDLGLLWLARHQSEGGYWSCAAFDVECDGEEGVCDGLGRPQFDVGVTGLALLCFVRSGHGPIDGPYAPAVRAGLRYLVDVQSPDGNFDVADTVNYTYSHFIATLAMVEAFALTRDESYGASAAKALRHTSSIRNPGAAWRYAASSPEMVKGRMNDVSVTSWALMGLEAARACGMDVDPELLAEPLLFVDEMTDPITGVTGYHDRGGRPARTEQALVHWPPDQSEAMTAAGVLCRLYVDPKLGLPGTKEMVEKGRAVLADMPPLWDDELPGRRDFYYWRHATEALARSGGREWKDWKQNLAMVLVEHVERTGDELGSWQPKVDPWGEFGGRVYSTSMMVLSATAAAAHP